MEEMKLTQEERAEASASFYMANLLGRAILAAAEDIRHPVGSTRIEYATEDDEKEVEPEPAVINAAIYSGEGSEDDQIAQLIAMYTPGLEEFLRRSALFDMLHLAFCQFNLEAGSLAADILTPENKRKAALAWVLVKRIFTIRHTEEAYIIISATDAAIRDAETISFQPLDDEDRQFVVELCALCSKILKKDMTIAEALASMANELKRAEKASQFNRLSPLGSAPNGDPINLLFRVMSSKGGRLLGPGNNRHEEIITSQQGDTYRIKKTNKQNGSAIIVEIAQAEKILSKTNKTFIKTMFFILQKMTAQNFPLEVGFSLQELVDLKMYSTVGNAWRAVQDFVKQQSNISLTGLIKKGNESIESKANMGLLFYNASLDNGYVRISVNDKFNMEFIASYFTTFPRFAYALNINAFNLVHYIFFLARQRTKDIKEKGSFNINLDSVRDRLGLPAPEEVKNRRYRQLIIDPIEDAIEEIEEALKTLPEAKECSFTITPVGTDTSNIHQWLAGHLEIGLSNDFAKSFVDIATKTEEEQEKFKRAKIKEMAKLAAKKETGDK